MSVIVRVLIKLYKIKILNMEKKARVIAWYLPQFHPIKENNETWGKGFTEWVNVAKAKPLFKGHDQPRIPADLGFYDLRIPEVRNAQAELAREAGVEGFMYWHYWFGDDKMLLEKPAEWVLQSGEPDFPFCFGWANHSWSTKTWKKGGRFDKVKMIAEMKYLGIEDNRKHFDYCLSFFKDHRYITVEGKPLFVIYSPKDFVGFEDFKKQWNDWAIENGLNGIYFVGIARNRIEDYETIKKYGYDGVCNNNRHKAESKAIGGTFLRRLKGVLGQRYGLIKNVYRYDKIMKYFFSDENRNNDCYPVITPGYDRSPRAGKDALIYSFPTPEVFKNHVHETVSYIKDKDYEHRIIFLDSWNEWAEGNYMEPDQTYGHAYLDSLREEILENDSE